MESELNQPQSSQNLSQNDMQVISMLVPGKVTNPINVIRAIEGARITNENGADIDFEIPTDSLFDKHKSNMQQKFNINKHRRIKDLVKLEKK